MLDVLGPVLHHRGQLLVLAVQVFLPCLDVFFTLLRLASHLASSPCAAPGSVVRSPSPRFSQMQEKQEEDGGREVHGGERGGEGRLLVSQGNLGRMFSDDCWGRIQEAGHSWIKAVGGGGGGGEERILFQDKLTLTDTQSSF